FCHTTMPDGSQRSDASGCASNLSGTGARDILVGGPARDVLRGGASNDVLNGAAGDDTLSGGTGNDILVGGPGRDILDGGPGADTLIDTSGATLVRTWSSGRGDDCVAGLARCYAAPRSSNSRMASKSRSVNSICVGSLDSMKSI